MENGNDVTFMLRLRALYAAQAYDRRDLARKVGVPVATLLAWEGGQKVPDIRQLHNLAAYFGLPYEFFLSDLPPVTAKKETVRNWQIADRLGLSEGTVEKLALLAEVAPGKVLDSVDDAIFSIVKSHLDENDEWDGD